MSRQRTRNKARDLVRTRKKQEDIWLPGEDAVDAMPSPESVKQVRLRIYNPPINRKEQKKDFKRLGIPPTVYGTLWEWGTTTEAVESVLKFLKRVDFWWGAHKATIELAKRVYGRARDLYYKQRPAKRGEIDLFLAARKDLVYAIVRARMLHCAITHAYDPAIACALPHLETALNCLEQWPEIEVDPELPKRTPGRKPGLKMALREGEEPQPVRRRDIDRALQNLLLPLHPRRSKFEVKRFSHQLLNPILG